MEYSNLIGLLVLVTTVIIPFLRKLQHDRARRAVAARLERRRGSKVISMVHRQEAVSLLGIPVWRYIDIEDSERVLREIRALPPGKPVDLIMHTPGGLVLAAEQIAGALARHDGPVTVFVPHYAMSGGTLVALAADQIEMDPDAVLGPTDPQVGEYPAASLIRLKGAKDPSTIADHTYILIDQAEKAMVQVRTFVQDLLARRLPGDQARHVAEVLTDGRWTHDYPLTPTALTEMGLPVGHAMPSEVYELMDLYRQQGQRRPTALYTPMPRPGHEPAKR